MTWWWTAITVFLSGVAYVGIMIAFGNFIDIYYTRRNKNLDDGFIFFLAATWPISIIPMLGVFIAPSLFREE